MYEVGLRSWDSSAMPQNDHTKQAARGNSLARLYYSFLKLDMLEIFALGTAVEDRLSAEYGNDFRL